MKRLYAFLSFVLFSHGIVAFDTAKYGRLFKENKNNDEENILAKYRITETKINQFTKYEISNSLTGGKISTYYVSNFVANWADANDSCVRLIEKQLVSIENETKNNEVKAVIAQNGPEGYFTSGRFVVEKSSLTWLSTNEALSYTDWAIYSCSIFSADSCVILGVAAQIRNWHVVSCSDKWLFICE